MKISTNQFKNGTKLLIDNAPCSIIEHEFHKPGKGQAVMRVKYKNLLTGNTNDKTFKSGESAERDKLSISIGPYTIAEGGYISKDYDEDKVSSYMQNPNIDLTVDLGLGDGKANIYTCDLTHDYISINADYRS